jgi:glycosyltransferase involved in cell wall biosynthesis
MRLALLTLEPFHPPSGGGSAEAVYLARELVERGHELHVFSPPAADPAAVERDFGVRLHPFTRWEMGRYTRWRNVKYLLYPAFLERLVAAARAPFAVLLAQHAIASVAAGRLRQRLGVPVVMNFLDHLTAFMETWPAWLMPRPLLAALKWYELAVPARFAADGVLAVSDPLADRLVAAGCPRERVRPLYYGFDA